MIGAFRDSPPPELALNVAELLAKFGHMLDEFRELEREAQVAAVAEAVDGLAQQRAADLDPVAQRFAQRIAALAEDVGEEIGIEAQFLDEAARGVRDAAQRHAVLGGADVNVDAHLQETRLVGLHPDPMVAPEDGGALAGLVGLVHQRLAELDDEAVNELHPIEIAFRRHAAGGVVIALIHEILAAQAIAVFLREILERRHADGVLVAGPVAELVHGILVRIDREMIGQRGQPHDIGLGMILQVFVEVSHQVVPARLMVGIDADDVRLGPVVRQVVIHRGRVPDLEHEEIHRVNMERNGAANGDLAGPWIETSIARA